MSEEEDEDDHVSTTALYHGNSIVYTATASLLLAIRYVKHRPDPRERDLRVMRSQEPETRVTGANHGARHEVTWMVHGKNMLHYPT